MSVDIDEEKGLDEGGLDASIVLLSKEGEKFELPRKVAEMSKYIKQCIELDDKVREVPLKYIRTEIVKKIIEWMVYHESTPPRAIPRPLPTPNLKELVGVWDANYVDCHLEIVFEVLLAANYLDLQPLLDLTCAKVASLMLGKTPKQIRQTFNVREDFTPEEEAEIRKEFAEFL